jgi:conserved hypothetical protein TIGR01655
MKKGARITLIVVVVAVVFAAIGWFGVSYYQSRYAGKTYYTMVPLDEPVEITDLIGMNGDVIDSGYDYSLTAYNTDGESKLVEFPLIAENAEDLYQPGAFLQVEASEKIVVFQEEIARDEVPASVLPLIEGSK